MIRFVIDIGTNSTRLMKAEVEENRVQVLFKTLRTVRTGEGVHYTHRLSSEAMQRTVAALREYAELAQGSPVACFATSAVRDAANRTEFLRMVKAEAGLEVQVLSGEEEAQLGFIGAVGKDGTGTVIDIGGGSTEIIQGTAGQLEYRHSFNMGCVRGKDIFTPPFQKENVQQWARAILSEYGLPQAKNRPAYAIGGTATSLAAIDLGLRVYQRELVQGHILSLSAVRQMEQMLYAMELEQRKQLPGLEGKRADIIVFGVSILAIVMEEIGVEQVSVSDSDNLEGYLIKNS